MDSERDPLLRFAELCWMAIQVFKIHKWRHPEVAIWFVEDHTFDIHDVDYNAEERVIPVLVLHRPKNYQEIKFVSGLNPIWESVFPPHPIEVSEAYRICGGKDAVLSQLELAFLRLRSHDEGELTTHEKIPPHDEVGRFAEI